MTPRPIFFDLTEALLAASADRIRYYGIARTVIEVGLQLAQIDPSIRFVVFSFGDLKFYEIHPVVDSDGAVSFPIPRNAQQRWVRTEFGGAPVKTALANLIAQRITLRNQRAWHQVAAHLPAADLSNGVFVSAARPKLIVDMVKALHRSDAQVDVVPLLHDFMPLHRFSEKRFRRFDRNFLIDNRFVLEASKLVLTNSDFTLQELHRFSAKGMLPSPPPAVAVPFVQYCTAGTESAEVELPPRPYVLTVGSNLGRKNIEVVIKALTLLHERDGDAPGLVVAGAMRKRLSRYLAHPRHAKLREHVRFVVNPNQTDLVRLYENALALVMPSRIEGWGLPAGEALWCGTPAICSTAPVLREVCGDLGLYFDPDRPDELASILHDLMHDPAKLADLRQRIREARPGLRTWKHVANDVLASLTT